MREFVHGPLVRCERPRGDARWEENKAGGGGGAESSLGGGESVLRESLEPEAGAEWCLGKRPAAGVIGTGYLWLRYLWLRITQARGLA